MKRLVGILIAMLVMTVAVGAANAQIGMPDGTNHGSCYQVPTTEPASGTPAVTFRSLGWDLFLSNHANRLILALSQWHPMPNHATTPTRVRVSSVGNRVTR